MYLLTHLQIQILVDDLLDALHVQSTWQLVTAEAHETFYILQIFDFLLRNFFVNLATEQEYIIDWDPLFDCFHETLLDFNRSIFTVDKNDHSLVSCQSQIADEHLQGLESIIF